MANTYKDNKGLATDALEIYERFKTFTLKEMDSAVKSALSKGASVIAKQTKQNLKSRLPNSTKRNVTKYKDTLVDAVKSSIWKKKGNTPNEAKVHIMGNRDQYGGTFRTRFFEKGVADMSRKNTNGKIIFGGSIKPLHFFRDAVIATKDEVIQVIDETLEKKIREINDKKF